jgi:hypothetical protein
MVIWFSNLRTLSVFRFRLNSPSRASVFDRRNRVPFKNNRITMTITITITITMTIISEFSIAISITISITFVRWVGGLQNFSSVILSKGTEKTSQVDIAR